MNQVLAAACVILAHQIARSSSALGAASAFSIEEYDKATKIIREALG